MKAESRIEGAKKALFDEAVAKLKEKGTNYHEILQALRFALDGSVAPSFKKTFCRSSSWKLFLSQLTNSLKKNTETLTLVNWLVEKLTLLVEGEEETELLLPNQVLTQWVEIIKHDLTQATLEIEELRRALYSLLSLIKFNFKGTGMAFPRIFQILMQLANNRRELKFDIVAALYDCFRHFPAMIRPFTDDSFSFVINTIIKSDSDINTISQENLQLVSDCLGSICCSIGKDYWRYIFLKFISSAEHLLDFFFLFKRMAASNDSYYYSLAEVWKEQNNLLELEKTISSHLQFCFYSLSSLLSFATKEPVIVPTKPLVRLLEKVYDLQTHLRSLDSDKITLVEHAAVFICYENIQEYANHLLTRILKVTGSLLLPFAEDLLSKLLKSQLLSHSSRKIKASCYHVVGNIIQNIEVMIMSDSFVTRFLEDISKLENLKESKFELEIAALEAMKTLLEITPYLLTLNQRQQIDSMLLHLLQHIPNGDDSKARDAILGCLLASVTAAYPENTYSPIMSSFMDILSKERFSPFPEIRSFSKHGLFICSLIINPRVPSLFVPTISQLPAIPITTETPEPKFDQPPQLGDKRKAEILESTSNKMKKSMIQPEPDTIVEQISNLQSIQKEQMIPTLPIIEPMERYITKEEEEEEELPSLDINSDEDSE